MNPTRSFKPSGWWLIGIALVLATALYWPGLYGGYLFDDYPNIVDNHGVQPKDSSLPSLVQASLSSPASEFKRPLASLSFAANYMATGLDPFGMKLTNLVIHLFNGLLVFLLAKKLLQIDTSREIRVSDSIADHRRSQGITAAWIAMGWLLLPINLTGVLYVVQRMESLANAFVLLGLLGYVASRKRMQTGSLPGGLMLCIASLLIPTAMGLLAKETAVMLPLYAFLIEWLLFRFDKFRPESEGNHPKDKAVIALFALVLALPLLAGMAWLLPGLLKPETWANRDFTLRTRLLSEARIIVDYVVWTLAPTPEALSFYHDDFRISTGLLTPWTTWASMLALALTLGVAFKCKVRQPLVTLGIVLFLGAQLLTATILPLELIYEHRNYFASFGLFLAVIPVLTGSPAGHSTTGHFSIARNALLACLLFWWAMLTALTAKAWASPIGLAQELAARAPESPRAQYELGRTYIIYSHYNPNSLFILPARTALERAASLPGSSILPEQALIFMNSRMREPLKAEWWKSMIAKLAIHKPGVQDESSLAALTQCQREGHCELPLDNMSAAYMAALSHPNPSARLLSMYGDYAWNVLNDRTLGLRMISEAIDHAPREPAYRITQIRMLVAEQRYAEAAQGLGSLRALNVGGYLDDSLHQLETSIPTPH